MHTPMTDAILRLFGNLGDELARRQVPPGAVHAYIFGGCAVHLHAKSRASTDVDAEFAYPPPLKQELMLILAELPPVDYDDPEEGPSQLAYDPTFNPTLGPLHVDYQDRAVPIEGTRESPVIVMLPSIEDIALSKLGRLGDVDLEDILTLLSLPEASWEKFEQLALEANKYYVGPDLTPNLSHVRRKFNERRFS